MANSGVPRASAQMVRLTADEFEGLARSFAIQRSSEELSWAWVNPPHSASAFPPPVGYLASSQMAVRPPARLSQAAHPQGESVLIEELHSEPDDPALLPAPPTLTLDTLRLHIAFSQTYRTPVLILLGNSAADSWRAWGTSEASAYIQQCAGMSGGAQHPPNIVTQAEHPVLGGPCCILHPCNTAEVLAQMLDASKLEREGKGQARSHALDMISAWWSLVAPLVGLRATAAGCSASQAPAACAVTGGQEAFLDAFAHGAADGNYHGDDEDSDLCCWQECNSPMLPPSQVVALLGRLPLERGQVLEGKRYTVKGRLVCRRQLSSFVTFLDLVDCVGESINALAAPSPSDFSPVTTLQICINLRRCADGTSARALRCLQMGDTIVCCGPAGRTRSGGCGATIFPEVLRLASACMESSRVLSLLAGMRSGTFKAKEAAVLLNCSPLLLQALMPSLAAALDSVERQTVRSMEGQARSMSARTPPAPRQALARIERLERVAEARQPGLLLVMENISHKHNIAAMLRTCDAFGLAEAIIIEKPDCKRFDGRDREMIKASVRPRFHP